MKAIIHNNLVWATIPYDNQAYDFEASSWSPTPQNLYAFDLVYSPYIKAQATRYDALKEWFNTQDILAEVRRQHRNIFEEAFVAIDAKANRGNRGAVLALYDAISEGADPNAPQVIVDVGIIWELEQVADENRKLLADLESMTIPEYATLEEAQDILKAAIAIKPWLPWE